MPINNLIKSALQTDHPSAGNLKIMARVCKSPQTLPIFSYRKSFINL